MDTPIPNGFCQCGCGQPTSLITQNFAGRGLAKGQYRKYVYRHRAKDNRVERFWSKVDIGLPNECWGWQRTSFS